MGIGRACALRMAAEGAHVAIFDQLLVESRALARKLATQGTQAEYWQVDVSKESDVAESLREVDTRFGSVDVLVNNAGSRQAGADIWQSRSSSMADSPRSGVHATPVMQRANVGGVSSRTEMYRHRYIARAVDH